MCFCGWNQTLESFILNHLIWAQVHAGPQPVLQSLSSFTCTYTASNLISTHSLFFSKSFGTSPSPSSWFSVYCVLIYIYSVVKQNPLNLKSLIMSKSHRYAHMLVTWAFGSIFTKIANDSLFDIQGWLNGCILWKKIYEGLNWNMMKIYGWICNLRKENWWIITSILVWWLLVPKTCTINVYTYSHVYDVTLPYSLVIP